MTTATSDVSSPEASLGLLLETRKLVARLRSREKDLAAKHKAAKAELEQALEGLLEQNDGKKKPSSKD